MNKRHNSPTGLLLIDKEAGPTSADVIRKIKKIIGKKVKIGHAGTLDPDGMGLLVVLLGDATKLSETIMDLPKEYSAVVQFGVTTDTYDAAGKVTEEKSTEGLSKEAILAVLGEFEGKIMQVPPQYSAIKVNGKRSYELARQGKAEELPARETMVYELKLLEYSDTRAEIFVRCGKGMYLRSLAHDLGNRLGCGGHVKSLRRTKVGAMVPSVSLADLEHETWEESITNPAVVFEDSVVFRLNRRGALNLRRGLPVKAEDFVERPKEPVGKRTGVLDEDGSLIAIATIGHGGTLLERRILQAL